MRRSGVRSLYLGIVLAVFAWVVVAPAVAFAAPSAPDAYEPDDSPGTAQTITTDGVRQEHSLYPSYDHDWQKFDAVIGHAYEIRTGPGAPEPTVNNDFYLRLYASDGITELAYNDDGGPDNYSVIYWTAPASGTYYIENHAYGYNDYIGYYAVRVTDMTTIGASISGTVTSVSGPAPGVEVRVGTLSDDPWLTALDPNYNVYTPTTTGVDGTYTVWVPGGTHTVRFSGVGYTEQWYDASATEGGATTFVLDPPDARTAVNAVLEEKPVPVRAAWPNIRASVDETGGQLPGASYRPSMSADGRYVAFDYGEGGPAMRAATASQIEMGQYSHVIIRDMVTGAERSPIVGLEGTQPNDASYDPALSDDGNILAFASVASNLVPGDDNGDMDVFAMNLTSGETTCVSRGPGGAFVYGGAQDPEISGNGRYVVFASSQALVDADTNNARDIYLTDLASGETTLVSVAIDGASGSTSSYDPSISDDGRYVVFDSWASDLVEGDTNGERDVFLRDMQTGVTTRLSLTAGGEQLNRGSAEPAISGDGSRVVFISDAGLVAGDTNGQVDIYVKSRTGSDYVVLTDNHQQWEEPFYDLGLSRDGRFLVATVEPDLPGLLDYSGSSDIAVFDTLAGKSGLATISRFGKYPGNGDSYDACISNDGRYVAYRSYADDLVALDTNDNSDVFRSLIDRTPPVTTSDALSSYTGTAANVTLIATDTISGVENTFYSLDGGAETTYTAPIAVVGRGGHTLVFHSVDRFGNVEAAKTARLTLGYQLGRPWSRYSVHVRQRFECWGTIRPKVKSNLRVVTLKCYRLEGGTWVLRKTQSTRTYNRFWWRYTKYATWMSLPSKGRWRIVSTLSSGNGAGMDSPPRYLYVR